MCASKRERERAKEKEQKRGGIKVLGIETDRQRASGVISAVGFHTTAEGKLVGGSEGVMEGRKEVLALP